MRPERELAPWAPAPPVEFLRPAVGGGELISPGQAADDAPPPEWGPGPGQFDGGLSAVILGEAAMETDHNGEYPWP